MYNIRKKLMIQSWEKVVTDEQSLYISESINGNK